MNNNDEEYQEMHAFDIKLFLGLLIATIVIMLLLVVNISLIRTIGNRNVHIEHLKGLHTTDQVKYEGLLKLQELQSAHVIETHINKIKELTVHQE